MQMFEKGSEQRRRHLTRIMDLLIAKIALKLPHIPMVGRERMSREPARDAQIIAITRNE